MSKLGYMVHTEGAVALSPATAKTVLGVKGHANFGVDIQGFWISTDGLTSSNAVVLVEFCYCAFATNSPGTNSTSVSANYVYGGTAARQGSRPERTGRQSPRPSRR